MIVLTLTNCPHALRGDLTRWLFEVDTNIYVGKQSARVREKIWERVIKTATNGRAVMVYPDKNEQGFDFRVWGATWEPIDFDGLKLMLRPHPGKAHASATQLKPGFSKVKKRLLAKRVAAVKKRAPALVDTYVVVDVETTGFSPDTDEIMEIGAIKVVEDECREVFQALIRIQGTVPPHIEELTGITNETLVKEGRALDEVMHEFHAFVEGWPMVSHNIAFDMGFLRVAYERCALSMPVHACIDTLRMARKLLDAPSDYKLGTLLKYFGIERVGAHRVLGDCKATKALYEKLRSRSRGDIHEEERGETDESE
ncbi:MAG: type I-E CRISPR-associated endoribonuclease Cas2e [Cystobacterineae bacterium]|nr:type I-E CRISPR-associated endoribonuclease Cas2e [Cystobacterineae bacterium]